MSSRKSRRYSKLNLQPLEERKMFNVDWGSEPPIDETPVVQAESADEQTEVYIRGTQDNPPSFSPEKDPLFHGPYVPGFIHFDDRFEENDSQLDATRLGTVTESVTHQDLAMRDSADWYEFRLLGEPGSDAHVTVNFQHSQGDIDVQLYNAAGQMVGSSKGVGDSEQISLEGLEAGRYSIKVFGYAGAENPNYSLTIDPGSQDDRFEENDSQLQATRLGTVTEAVTHQDLAMRDSADWYGFRLLGEPGSDAHVTVNFQHSQGDIDVQLYNAAGQMVGGSNGVGNSERISLDGLEAGPYSIKVFGYAGAENPNYSLTIDPGSQDDRFEENDSQLQATRLGTVTEAVTHQDLAMRDSADWYGFRLIGEPGSDAHVTVNFQHSQGDIDVQLYNAAGQMVGRSNGVGNSERISLEGLEAGPYSIKVFGYAGAENPNYSLTIDPGSQDDRFEENDSQLQATRLGTITQAVTHDNLAMRDSADWYGFRLIGEPGSDAHVTLNFQHSQGDIDVQLYNAAGQVVGSSNGVGNSERISLEGLEAGPYSIKVFGYAGAENPNYSLTIDPGSQDDRFEENDSQLQATRLGTITQAVTHDNLAMHDSADWYGFRLLGEPGSDAHITLNFQHSQGDIDVQLYNAAGQVVGSSTSAGNSERISLAGLEAGPYSIKVYGYAGAENPNYSMTIDPGSSRRSRIDPIDAIFEELGQDEEDPLDLDLLK